MELWIYTIGSVVLVSALSFIGILSLLFDRERLNKMLLFLVSFAIGGLFGDAFIHLLPESFEKLGTKLTTSLLIVFGILLFLYWKNSYAGGTAIHLHQRIIRILW